MQLAFGSCVWLECMRGRMENMNYDYMLANIHFIQLMIFLIRTSEKTAH